LRHTNLNTPSAVITNKNTAHRTDLLPNMVWRKLQTYMHTHECVLPRNKKRPKKVLDFTDLTCCFKVHDTHHSLFTL
jgi:hypothetical protein